VRVASVDSFSTLALSLSLSWSGVDGSWFAAVSDAAEAEACCSGTRIVVSVASPACPGRSAAFAPTSSVFAGSADDDASFSSGLFSVGGSGCSGGSAGVSVTLSAGWSIVQEEGRGKGSARGED
jgi:hypothetical protein